LHDRFLIHLFIILFISFCDCYSYKWYSVFVACVEASHHRPAAHVRFLSRGSTWSVDASCLGALVVCLLLPNALRMLVNEEWCGLCSKTLPLLRSLPLRTQLWPQTLSFPPFCVPVV